MRCSTLVKQGLQYILLLSVISRSSRAQPLHILLSPMKHVSHISWFFPPTFMTQNWVGRYLEQPIHQVCLCVFVMWRFKFLYVLAQQGQGEFVVSFWDIWGISTNGKDFFRGVNFWEEPVWFFCRGIWIQFFYWNLWKAKWASGGSLVVLIMSGGSLGARGASGGSLRVAREFSPDLNGDVWWCGMVMCVRREIYSGEIFMT